jgi:hypothetical protein
MTTDYTGTPTIASTNPTTGLARESRPQANADTRPLQTMPSETSNTPPILRPHNGPSEGLFKKLVSLLSDSATYGLSSVIAQAVQFFLLPVYTYQIAYGRTALSPCR